MDSEKFTQCVAPINIAVIKYWGKRDENLKLPLNSSISATLHYKSLFSMTKITASKNFNENRFVLNQKDQKLDIENDNAISKVFKHCKRLSTKLLDDHKFIIESHNNFPTAAGLASSASGFACLTKCFSELFGVEEEYEGQLSAIARMGSGSACRSLYGGWVEWKKGLKSDGSDSVARQIKSELWWPEMRVLILIVNARQKKVGSTEGMRRSVQTSEILKTQRIVNQDNVEKRIAEMVTAIEKKDFTRFAKLTIQESNQLHAICLDSYPPIFYLSESSKQIIDFVHYLNTERIRAAYTFDAGPNAFLFVLEKDMDNVLTEITKEFGEVELEDELNIAQSGHGRNDVEGMKGKSLIQKIIVTKLGPGPMVVSHTG